MMTKDGLIFEANSLKQGRLQALTRQQLQAQATQNRERRWVPPCVDLQSCSEVRGRRFDERSFSSVIRFSPEELEIDDPAIDENLERLLV